MKKLLATILALVMALGVTTVAWAADDVAEVSGTKYQDLQTAVNEADGKTVKMLANVDVNQSGLSVGKSIVLDLNGKTLKAGEKATNNIRVTSSGSLTVKDSAGGGKIYTEEAYTSGPTGANNCVINVSGGFVLESGTIYAVITGDPANKGQFGVGVHPGGTATINGGRIEAGWYAVATNGLESDTAIIVNGGELISIADYAIYNPAKNSKVTINDGTIYGYSGGIAMHQGVLEVKNGTITSKGTGSTGNWGDGTGNMSNAAIYVGKDGNSNVTATISGGKITAEGNAVELNTAEGNAKVTLTVSGGVFSNSISEDYLADEIKYEVYVSGEGFSYYSDFDSTAAAANDDDSSEITKIGTDDARDVPFHINYADGTGVKPKLWMSKDNFELPTPTRSGYTFKGWKIALHEGEQIPGFTGTYTSEQVKDIVFAEAATDGGAINRFSDGAYLTAVWSANSYYYYSPSTTTPDTTKGSPKTFDAGVGIYAVTALLSVTGMAWAGKKRH